MFSGCWFAGVLAGQPWLNSGSAGSCRAPSQQLTHIYIFHWHLLCFLQGQRLRGGPAAVDARGGQPGPRTHHLQLAHQCAGSDVWRACPNASCLNPRQPRWLADRCSCCQPAPAPPRRWHEPSQGWAAACWACWACCACCVCCVRCARCLGRLATWQPRCGGCVSGSRASD